MIKQSDTGKVWAVLMILGAAIGIVLQQVLKVEWVMAVSVMVAVAIAFFMTSSRARE